jgi:isopenicillin-N N-acyltransferase like protein
MTVASYEPAEPLDLVGDAYARGRAQAALCPDLIEHVRHAIAHRLEQTAAALDREEVREFIAAQRQATEMFDTEILEEIRGIAEGFGIAPATLFDYLHCSSAMDIADLVEHRPDGCTSIAMTARGGGAIVAKNRDYRAEHIPIQKVMRHSDPAWGGRRLLVIGSLGSPGNFSSGMNSDGLAISDTASRTIDMGPGFHRYFLLTWLLVHCRNVEEAMRAIKRVVHTGSGLLLLGDASGAVAAVELGHREIGFEHRSSGRVGRTNHFVTPRMAPRNLDVAGNAASRANSVRRFEALVPMVEAMPAAPDIDDVRALLAHHRDDRGEAFCRHGEDDLSTTIAGAIWDTSARRLFMAAGNPCSADWRSYDLQPRDSRAAAE